MIEVQDMIQAWKALNKHENALSLLSYFGFRNTIYGLM